MVLVVRAPKTSCRITVSIWSPILDCVWKTWIDVTVFTADAAIARHAKLRVLNSALTQSLPNSIASNYAIRNDKIIGRNGASYLTVIIK
jgi:hypothetical protein